jgi:murein lipoprotein
MKISKKQIAVVTVLCSVVLTGCATRSDIDALRSEIQSLQQSTDKSLKVSQDARDIASKNSAELVSVRRAADQAKSQAQQANEKADRVFETSMRK